MVNMELNIFKIKDESGIDEIISKVKENAENKYMYRNLEKDIYIDKKAYNLKFFFYMNENPSATIDWYAEISNLFENEEIIKKKVYSGYGILLIYCDKFKYVITFGRATYLLSEFIDWDFGLEMAAKMLDKNSINAQSSKYFSTSKNKSLIVYNKGKFNTEAGESVDLINATISEVYGKSTINSLCNYISSKVGFSSGLKIVVSMEEIKIIDIVNVIILLNTIYNKYINRLNIPKLLFIKSNDELIEKLKKKLNNDILSSENVNVSLSMYAIVDSDITLMNNITKYKLTYDRKGTEYNVLDIEDIREFMIEHEIKDIEEIGLKIFLNDSIKNLNILKIIDYTTEIEDENAYFCLYDGRWAKFNVDYINKVNEMIEGINNTIVSYDNSYDLSYTELENIKEKYCKDISKELNIEETEITKETLKKLYREFVYNYKVCREKNGILLDRKKFNQIEVCDIYYNKQLIHTKIGSPGNFNECINQSANGFEVWNYNKQEIKEQLGITDVEGVTLLLITDNKNVIKNKNINKFKSVRFKLNLIDWQRQVEEYGKKANIIIAELKS